MDPITLGLLAVGGVFLVLWRQSQKKDNDREEHRITKGLVDMDNDSSGPRQRPTATPKLPEVLTRDLPPKMDEGRIKTRIAEHLALFRSTESLLEQYMMYLRNRYYQRWELDILRGLEQTLAQEIRTMNTITEHEGTSSTMWERTEAVKLKAQTDYENTRQEYEKARARSAENVRLAELEAENARLRAENENRDLKQKLAGEQDRPAGPAAAAPDPVSRAKATVARIKELEEQMARELEGLDPKSERAMRIKKIYQDLIRRQMEGD